MTINRSSFCEARDKLSWEAFAYLLDQAKLDHHKNYSPQLWRGHRVRAIDGTFIQLPRSQEILQHFFSRNAGKNFDTHYPYMQIVLAVDIFTGQTIHSAISSPILSERQRLYEILQSLQPGDISVLDRGFVGPAVWKAFADHKQHFVGRLRCKAKNTKFNKNLKDQIVTDKTELGEPLFVRVVRGRQLRTGDFVFVATNLLDSKKYSRREVLELYQKRQAVEDVFLHLKQTLEVKNIRSKKLNGVLQEIYAALTMLTIVAGLRYQFEIHIKKRRVSLKALCWRLEVGFDWLMNAFDNRSINRFFIEVRNFYHHQQKGRVYPRWSHQPPSKWITARRYQKYRAQKRAKTR